MSDPVPDEPGAPVLDQTGPLSWRVSPGQTALLFLIVCAAAALNIYTHPSIAARAITIGIGLIALAMAIASLRMFLVVDGEGITVRYLRRAVSIPWSQIDGIDIASGVRGSDTIRFNRPDGSYVDTPPSLLQPSLPTSKPATRRRLKGVLAELEARRPADPR